MAIHFKDGSILDPNAPQDFAAQRFKKGDIFGISNLVVDNEGGEQYEKIFKEFEQRVNESNEKVGNTVKQKYRVLKLLKPTYNVYYSAILLVLTGDVTTVHIYILEGTNTPPTSRSETLAGTRYDVLMPPSAVYDDRYLSEVRRCVTDNLPGVKAESVIVTDSTLVPSEFNPDTPRATSVLLTVGDSAVATEYNNRVYDDRGFSIPEATDNNTKGKFLISISYNTADVIVTDQVGMPVRQDICVTLLYSATSAYAGRSLNDNNNVKEILRVYGYVDFLWTPRPTYGPGYYPGMVLPPCFIPNFIITHIDTKAKPLSPSMLALAIASAVSVNENTSWVHAFRPTQKLSKGVIDFNDIGALNIEGNVENNPAGFGKKVNTKDPQFTHKDFIELVSRLIQPSISISLDVAVAGPSTWSTSILSSIVLNKSAVAFERFNDYIVKLTNGAFPANRVPILQPHANRFHAGYYKDKNSYRDLRSLSNYLAVANFVDETKSNPVLLAEYTNTVYNTGLHEEFRLATRKKFIDDMSYNTAVYKQYYYRLTFTGAFITDLVNSLAQAGFKPELTNAPTGTDAF